MDGTRLGVRNWWDRWNIWTPQPNAGRS